MIVTWYFYPKGPFLVNPTEANDSQEAMIVPTIEEILGRLMDPETSNLQSSSANQQHQNEGVWS